mgnify:CR=1 FL=1
MIKSQTQEFNINSLSHLLTYHECEENGHGACKALDNGIRVLKRGCHQQTCRRQCDKIYTPG